MRQSTRWIMTIAGLAFGLASASSLPAQQASPGGGEGRGAYAGMPHVEGEVTAVAGATVTVKTADGAVMQIVTTDNTRIMKGRGNTVKVVDLKPGDGVVAVGNLDAPNKTLHAAMLFATDAAQLRAMRENLGKTYIAGRVTAIDVDNAKMTVERPDHVPQIIAFDESTSFRRGGRGAGVGGFGGAGAAAAPPAEAPASGESITLADIKVGDAVRGNGALKAGVFVPTQLIVNSPGSAAGGGRRRRGDSGTSEAATQAASPATAPGSDAPPSSAPAPQ